MGRRWNIIALPAILLVALFIIVSNTVLERTYAMDSETTSAVYTAYVVAWVAAFELGKWFSVKVDKRPKKGVEPPEQ